CASLLRQPKSSSRACARFFPGACWSAGNTSSSATAPRRWRRRERRSRKTLRTPACSTAQPTARASVFAPATATRCHISPAKKLSALAWPNGCASTRKPDVPRLGNGRRLRGRCERGRGVAPFHPPAEFRGDAADLEAERAAPLLAALQQADLCQRLDGVRE